MTNYTTGRTLEYKVRDALQANGYQVLRAAGSKGVSDLIALKPGEVLLVQVKTSGPQISPNERAALLNLARITKAVPLVAYKPFRKPIEYRELTGESPKDHRPWLPDRVGAEK